MFFKNNLGFLRRRRLKAAQVKVKCPNCPSVYTHELTLKNHLRYECGLSPRFKCPYCPYMAKRAGNVVDHTKRRHRNMKPYFLDTLGSYKPRKQWNS
ncbi:Similar to lola: Longitudinals lacking protein [Cotesia congregata]|uniref:Isoforms A/B/D/L (Drosophila melanogaster) n=1 Tax=Cotesia congregata TaxID=51543 RepID=A0A8J2MNY8_COTCN|nr:Similar to lola: Longitudinals lacking protein [Cotesia congregata]